MLGPVAELSRFEYAAWAASRSSYTDAYLVLLAFATGNALYCALLGLAVVSAVMRVRAWDSALLGALAKMSEDSAALNSAMLNSSPTPKSADDGAGLVEGRRAAGLDVGWQQQLAGLGAQPARLQAMRKLLAATLFPLPFVPLSLGRPFGWLKRDAYEAALDDALRSVWRKGYAWTLLDAYAPPKGGSRAAPLTGVSGVGVFPIAAFCYLLALMLSALKDHAVEIEGGTGAARGATAVALVFLPLLFLGYAIATLRYTANLYFYAFGA